MSDDFRDGNDKDRNAPTVRDLKGPSTLPSDTVPDLVGQYVPPRPPPEASRHRTIDLRPVRLSDVADPRRWRTERRLVAPKPRAKNKAVFWLAGVVLVFIALGAWALFGASAAPETDATAGVSVTPPSPAAPSTPPIAEMPAAAPQPPPTVVASALPVSSAAAEPEATPEPASPAPPSRPRPVKKRKNPWLE